MGNAFAALIYLGLGAASSVLATSARKTKREKKRKYFLGNMLVGSTGAWLGGALFGAVGPSVYGISLVTTALSAASAVLGYNIISDRIEKKDDSSQEARS